MLRVELLLRCVVAGCSAPEFNAQPSADAGGLDSNSGGASGGSGAGGSGGSSGAGSEDCTNGQDDDGDGQADCADLDDCACVPQVLAGWQGPYFVTPAASGDAEPVECPQVAPTEVNVLGQLDVPPTQCPSCDCGNAMGSCSNVSVSRHALAKCADAASTVFGNLSTSCQQTVFSGSSPKSMSATVTLSGGKCPALTIGDVVTPAPSLTQRKRVCSGALGSCASGHCVAALPPGFRACVLGTTAQACPKWLLGAGRPGYCQVDLRQPHVHVLRL